MTATIIDFDRDTFEEKIEKVVEGYLEDYHLEDLFEDLQVSPTEAFLAVLNAGLIDEDLLEAYLTSE